MPDQPLNGSCLCKAVRYQVTPPFMRFSYCYCSRCRKATGGVRATNIAVPIDQFRWTRGEELIASSSDLERIAADDHAKVPALKGWRHKVFGEEALALKHGKLALTAKGRSIRIISLE